MKSESVKEFTCELQLFLIPDVSRALLMEKNPPPPPALGVGGVLTAVFLGSPLKCPHSKHFFFQDGVDEGQRHRPVASQQAGLHGRAVDAAEHRLAAHGVGHRQHSAVLLQPVAAGEAEAAARDAAPPPADRGRGEPRR